MNINSKQLIKSIYSTTFPFILLTHTELSYTSVNFTNYWNTLIAININTIPTKESVITIIPKKLFLPKTFLYKWFSYVATKATIKNITRKIYKIIISTTTPFLLFYYIIPYIIVKLNTFFSIIFIFSIEKEGS